jgi:ferritin-like metal-binding protein YciE
VPITNTRELLLHELGDILYAERLLVKTLPKLAREARDDNLRQGFEHHLEETREQVRNIESVFESIGESVKVEQCPGIDGIKQEHDKFLSDEKPSPDVLDLFLTGAGARVEHYEIAAYTGMIAMARSLGERGAVRLLQQNLRQEKEALKTLEATSRRLLRLSGRNGADDAEKMTKEDLMHRAQRLNVAGRSRMSKKELLSAIERAV